MDFIWNQQDGERVRAATVSAMQSQAAQMRNTASNIERNAAGMVGGAKKAQGNLFIAAQTLRNGAANLDEAVNRTNRLFNSLFDISRDTDSTAAQRMRQMTGQINSYNRWLQELADRFDNAGQVRFAAKNAKLAAIFLSIDKLMADGSEVAAKAVKRLLDLADNLLISYGRPGLRLAGAPDNCASGLDPINLATGNFYYSKEDISIPGRYPIIFERFYNALESHDDILGNGWTHNYNIRLLQNEDNAHIIFGDGHTETYTLLEDDFYISPRDRNNSLITVKDDKVFAFDLLIGTQQRLRFDSMGRLRQVENPNREKTELEYKDEVLLSKVSTPSGSMMFYYNDDGRLISVADHTGRQVNYQYAGNLLVKAATPGEAEYCFEYDENGKLKKVINPQGVEAVLNQYDEKGRAVVQTLPGGSVANLKYNDDEKSTEVSEPNDNKTIYFRDDSFRTTKVLYSDGSSEVYGYDDRGRDYRISYTDRNKNSWSYEYDSFGNVTSIKDPLGHCTEIKYNSHNQPTFVARPNGAEIKNIYDNDNRLISATDALGREVKCQYDTFGRIAAMIMPDGSQVLLEYDNRGNITKVTEASGFVSSYNYDSLNRVIASFDGKGSKTSYEYDASGNITKATDALGNTCGFTYNKSGKLLAFTDVDGLMEKIEYNQYGRPERLIDKLGRQTHVEYDKMLNPTQITDPGGAKTILDYDAFNRLTSVSKADGGTKRYEYDAKGNTTGIIDESGERFDLEYDAADRLICVTGALGFKISYAYNEIGQVISATDAGGNVAELEYDLHGQLICEINTLGEKRVYTYTSLGDIETITDEYGRVTTHKYHPGGLLEAIEYWDGTEESFVFDENGNITEHESEFGIVTYYEFDELDRVIKTTVDGGGTRSCTYDVMSHVTSVTDELGNTTKFDYTPTGRLQKVTDALGNETEYKYDMCDRLIEVSGHNGQLVNVTKYHRNMMGQIETVEDALGNKESYKYCPRGQLLEKLDKDGFLTKYAYDAHGDVTNIKYADGREVMMSYNALRQLTSVKDRLGEIKLESDAEGGASRVINFDGKAVEYSYDLAARQKKILYPDGKAVLYEFDEYFSLSKISDGAQSISYFYDAEDENSDGYLTKKLFSCGAGSSYSYDELGRLSEHINFDAEGVLERIKYTYDPAGNKKTMEKHQGKSSEIFAYHYDPLQRLCKVEKDNKPLRSYSYDAFGNRTAMASDGGEKIEYQYNALNQLVSSSCGAKYSYDKRGNLIEISGGSAHKKFSYGASNRLEKADDLSSGKSVVYQFNAMGRKIGSRLESGGEVLQQVDDVIDFTSGYNNLLQRAVGGKTTSYIYDEGIAFSRHEDNYENFLIDELGSPMHISDAKGIKRESFEYDEFGIPSDKNKTSSIFAFTGYRNDDFNITGTFFAQAREYNPTLGRFAAADPHWHPENMIWGDPGLYEDYEIPMHCPDFYAIRQSGNLYEYVMNNPLVRVDREGECFATIGKFIGKTVLPSIGISVGTELHKQSIKMRTGQQTGLCWRNLGLSVAKGAIFVGPFKAVGLAITVRGYVSAIGGAISNLFGRNNQQAKIGNLVSKKAKKASKIPTKPMIDLNAKRNANAQLKAGGAPSSLVAKRNKHGGALLGMLATGATVGFVARLSNGLSGLDMSDVENETDLPELDGIEEFLARFGMSINGGFDCDFS